LINFSAKNRGNETQIFSTCPNAYEYSKYKINRTIKKNSRHAVEKAKQKGVRESLILMKDMAFVVSIKNKTVITAMDEPV